MGVQAWPEFSAFSIMNKTKNSQICRAFSLVEVVLALGLVSFCLLAIVGLLPVGLQSVKNAKEGSAAANALSQIATGLRNATTANGISYQASGGFDGITWNADGAAISFSQPLSLEGQPDPTEVQLQGHVELVASGNKGQPCVAQISVAWPASATWTSGGWIKSGGSISSGIIFLPRQ